MKYITNITIHIFLLTLLLQEVPSHSFSILTSASNLCNQLYNTLSEKVIAITSVATITGAALLWYCRRKKQTIKVVAKSSKQEPIKHVISSRPLREAIVAGNMDTALSFIDNNPSNIDINEQDENGETALSLSVIHNNQTLFDRLMTYPNIDINTVNKHSDHTPLLEAINKSNTLIAQALLKSPYVDVKATDCIGQTALHMAVAANNQAIIDALMKRKDILDFLNTRDSDGDTALMSALRRKASSQELLFLNNPLLDVTIENNRGETAFTLIETSGYDAGAQKALKNTLKEIQTERKRLQQEQQSLLCKALKNS